MPSTHTNLHFHIVFSTKERLPLITDFGKTGSPNAVENVRSYVLNQVEHHKKKTFKEEYIELLKASRTEYDDKFLW
jgi:hypothetical protein